MSDEGYRVVRFVGDPTGYRVRTGQVMAYMERAAVLAGCAWVPAKIGLGVREVMINLAQAYVIEAE